MLVESYPWWHMYNSCNTLLALGPASFLQWRICSLSQYRRVEIKSYRNNCLARPNIRLPLLSYVAYCAIKTNGSRPWSKNTSIIYISSVCHDTVMYRLQEVGSSSQLLVTHTRHRGECWRIYWNGAVNKVPVQVLYVLRWLCWGVYVCNPVELLSLYYYYIYMHTQEHVSVVWKAWACPWHSATLALIDCAIPTSTTGRLSSYYF